jgi:hypothetical protein
VYWPSEVVEMNNKRRLIAVSIALHREAHLLDKFAENRNVNLIYPEEWLEHIKESFTRLAVVMSDLADREDNAGN